VRLIGRRRSGLRAAPRLLLRATLLAGGTAALTALRPHDPASGTRAAGAQPTREPPALRALAAPPRGFVLDGRVAEWPDDSAAMRGGFVRAAGAAAGKFGATLWVALNEGGLWVAGRVADDHVRLTSGAGDLLTADHPEVWLAFAPVAMPPLGYGNQFEFFTPEHEEFCRNAEERPRCAAWVELQRRRRALLPRLFARQYVPNHDGRVRELYGEVAERDARLGLDAATRCCAAARSGVRATPGGYSFELYVPAEELPAAAEHPIAAARLLVDFVDNDRGTRAQEAVWTSAPGRRFGAPETFDALRIALPLRFDVAPPLLAWIFTRSDSLRRHRAEAYTPGYGVMYFPGRPVRRALAVTNVHQGYQYEPERPSPELVLLGLIAASRPLGECGPATAVPAVTGVDGLGLPIHELLGVLGGAVVSHAPLAAYTSGSRARRLARAPCQHLVFTEEPPRSALGTGQGGATPVPTLQVVSLDLAGHLDTLLLEEAQTVFVRLPPDTTFKQEIVPEHTGHPARDVTTVAPVRADSLAPFGFVWKSDGEDRALRTLLFRWNAGTRRYVRSDSAGRFGSP
jgi:hypothetical protein